MLELAYAGITRLLEVGGEVWNGGGGALGSEFRRVLLIPNHSYVYNHYYIVCTYCNVCSGIHRIDTAGSLVTSMVKLSPQVLPCTCSTTIASPAVDDGSGVIPCCQWRKAEGSDQGLLVPGLGQLVSVYGRVSEFRGERQLRVYSIGML